MTNHDEDDVSFLDIRKEDLIPVPPQEKVWATIGENLALEYIDWAVINGMATQFDDLHKSNQPKSETHVMCKLIALVRDSVAEDTKAKMINQFKQSDWGRDEFMVIAAVRYCIGRKTYVVSDCVDWLIANWKNFEKSTRDVIRGDLEWSFEEDDRDRAEKREHKKLGFDMDRRQWERVRALWGNDK